MILGEAVAAACDDPAVLARLGGPLGEAARAAAAELAALSADARKARRAVWAAAARTPVPAGLRGVHGSWIEAALDALPPRTRRDLAGGGGDRVGVWLARTACAGIPPMPPTPLRALHELTDVEALLALPAVPLQRVLARVGADQLVLLAICSKTTELVQRTPGSVGELLRASLARVWPFFRKDVFGPLRDVTRRCAGVTTDELGLVRIGARTVAPHVAMRVDGAAVLAHRLPRELGLVVRAELDAFAATPLGAAPMWRAIAAGGVIP